MRRTEKDLIINIGIFVITLFFLFLMLELYFRIFVYTSFKQNDNIIKFIQRSDNPKLLYELIPNAEGYIYDKKVIINPRGERGKLYSYNKADDIIRIVFIGDSITFGFGNLLNETYPYLVEKKIERANSINLGVFAYNTAQQVESLRVKGLKYSPDVVVVGFYLSNPEEYWNRIYEPKTNLFMRLPKYSAVFRYIFDSYRALDTKYFYSEVYNFNSSHWKNFEEAMNKLEYLSIKHHFKVIFVIHPRLYNFGKYPLEEYHKIAKDIALNKGFIVIDMLNYYKDYDFKQLKIVKQDYIHPNYRGNQIISDAVVNKISDANQ